MSRNTRMTLAQYVVSFADRADGYVVPENRTDSEVSAWQTRQIARLSRIADKLGSDVSEFDYAPVDFADADYILKGMSAVLKACVCDSPKRKPIKTRKVAEEAVKAAEKAMDSLRQPTIADIGQMAISGKLGKVAQNRAAALVA